MYIISSYKDFYDYLQGVNGIDEKIILDRSKGSTFKDRNSHSSSQEGDKVVLYIFNQRYILYYYNNKWYTEEQLKELDKQPIGNYYSCKVSIEDYVESKKDKYYYLNRFTRKMEDKPITVNTKLNCPILLASCNENKFIEYPRLADYNFASIISPEEMWISLYNWLSKEKVEPNNQTDKEKIVSHGFDLKSSFRNIK